MGVLERLLYPGGSYSVLFPPFLWHPSVLGETLWDKKRNQVLDREVNHRLVRGTRFYGDSDQTGRRRWHPLQYSCLENPMDGGAWWAAVHGIAGSRTWLSDFAFTFHFHALEKEMATHSSVLAWRIPGTGEPDGLPSMGSHRVGHDWSDLAAAAAADQTEKLSCFKPWATPWPPGTGVSPFHPPPPSL